MTFVHRTFGVALGSLVALAACSLRDLDHLRDPSCAPNCGDGGADATAFEAATEAAADTAPSACDPNLPYRDLVLCDGPVAYFRLDEASGTAAANAIAGKPAGTYVSPTPGAISFGIVGAITNDTTDNRAVHFDGTASVSAGLGLDFRSRSAMSLEAWVAPDVHDAEFRRIFDAIAQDAGGTRDGYVLVHHQSEGLQSQRFVADAVHAAKAPVVSTTTYSHVVSTFDGTTLTLYVNGEKAGPLATVEASAPLLDIPAPLVVGNRSNGTAGWIGKIDEVAVYDHALTAEQIRAHYRAARR